MTGSPTGVELRSAARRLKLRQKDVARATGLSVRTVSRLFNTDGPLDTRLFTVRAVAGALGLRPALQTGAVTPPVIIELPLDALRRARHALPGLWALLDISCRVRRKTDILDRMSGELHRRLSAVSLRDGELYFDWIGGDIRWAGDHVAGSRPADIVDPDVAGAAVTRYWKALFTADPVFQYVRTIGGLEFAALTVATDVDADPGLVTVSAIGRPPLANATMAPPVSV